MERVHVLLVQLRETHSVSAENLLKSGLECFSPSERRFVQPGQCVVRYDPLVVAKDALKGHTMRQPVCVEFGLGLFEAEYVVNQDLSVISIIRSNRNVDVRLGDYLST